MKNYEPVVAQGLKRGIIIYLLLPTVNIYMSGMMGTIGDI